LFFIYFQNLKVLYSYLLTSHSSGHSHPFKYSGRIRSRTNRTRRSKSVVLTVCSLHYPSKVVSFHNTLESFTFRSSCYVHILTFCEYVYIYFISYFQIVESVVEFNQFSFRSRASLFKVAG